jgi:hypothetical protein
MQNAGSSTLPPVVPGDGILSELPPPKYTDVSLETLRRQQQLFAEERQWQQFHTPRNVLLALVGEVSRGGPPVAVRTGWATKAAGVNRCCAALCCAVQQANRMGACAYRMRAVVYVAFTSMRPALHLHPTGVEPAPNFSSPCCRWGSCQRFSSGKGKWSLASQTSGVCPTAASCSNSSRCRDELLVQG